MHPVDRVAVLERARARYGTEPETLWARFPNHLALRHRENRRWYALLMEVPARSLGLPGEGRVDILNVKCDPLLVGSLRRERGILPAYHMDKDHWISVLLDGSVPWEQLTDLLEMSYRLTQGRR
ncbi:MmcQ/YjbR family DNA-binding protein [Bittarella massiliensis (ex Durand et al. 2017)]|uniref:MmcQ/YjbR family DNA-binding protein n=1 Tax=Bittarella massiliensis (ex Durand et al. 2017) TaxID=1720313 RepID=UPI000A9A38A1|nr:MmcQ/YjbR family DNA-binding protein [Bittarella massiliensis (ex Durand et al. 2017)]